MTIKASQCFTRAQPSSKLGRIIQFPLLRIVVIIAFLLPAPILHNLFLELVLVKFEKPLYSHLLNIETIIIFGLFLLLYRLYTKYVEQREAHEISGYKAVGETWIGFLIGGGLIVFMVGLISLLGYFRIEGYDHWMVLVNAIFLFGMGAFVQELFFRQTVFRLVEEWLGTWLALVTISLIFAGAHLGNPNVTVWSTCALVLQDILLTAAFIYTRRIWLVWGLHAGWNFLQDGVFGMANSGVTTFDSWMTSTVDGPGWITGGAFGIEGSLITTALCVGLGIFVLLRAIGKGQLVLPSWQRIK
jgi:membrane protease YdiL (CAAX protease family)